MAPEINRIEKRRAYWRAHVEGQVGSGRTVAQYCREHGLNISAFYRWRRQLKQSAGPSAPAAAFAEIRVAPRSSREEAAAGRDRAETPVEILLGNGRAVRVWAGFEASVLERVLAIADGAGRC